MFAGIGGFREGLRRAGGFECVGHCEQDEHAERSYRVLFDTRGEWFCDDIRKADAGSMPDFELLCGGFPCQSFSIAGSRHGFADPRGTLFFELARVAEARKPQYLLFENVPGLRSSYSPVPQRTSSSGRYRFKNSMAVICFACRSSSFSKYAITTPHPAMPLFGPPAPTENPHARNGRSTLFLQRSM